MRRLASLPLNTEYRKGKDDITQDFYLPCMRVADRYDRAVAEARCVHSATAREGSGLSNNCESKI